MLRASSSSTIQFSGCAQSAQDLPGGINPASLLSHKQNYPKGQEREWLSLRASLDYARISAATFHRPDAVSDKAPLVSRWLEGRGLPDAPERRNKGTRDGPHCSLYSWHLSQHPGWSSEQRWYHMLTVESGRCLDEFAAE